MSHASLRLEYSAALGETIVTWNRAEGAFRALLATLCGESAAAQIVTAELGGVGITNALNAIAVTLDAPIKTAVESVAKYFDVLREYRNYYVHGIQAIGVADGAGVGRAFMASAKGELKYAEDTVTSNDLNALKTQAEELTQAIIAILDTVSPREGSRAKSPLPTSETLIPPDKLKKTIRYPLNVKC